jgi:hypothetical protein
VLLLLTCFMFSCSERVDPEIYTRKIMVESIEEHWKFLEQLERVKPEDKFRHAEGKVGELVDEVKLLLSIHSELNLDTLANEMNLSLNNAEYDYVTANIGYSLLRNYGDSLSYQCKKIGNKDTIVMEIMRNGVLTRSIQGLYGMGKKAKEVFLLLLTAENMMSSS